MTSGIGSWGVYLPYWRLERKAIGLALGTPPGRGTRSVASYDEDTTTLGWRRHGRPWPRPAGPAPERLYFSTPEPAYQDKTNATTIHAALGLPQRTAAYDLVGSVRSGAAALTAALDAAQQVPTLAVVAEAANRPGRRGRRAGLGRRGGGLHAGARRRGRRDGRRAVGERGVPRPMAGPGRGTARTSGRSASASRPMCPWPRPPSPTP